MKIFCVIECWQEEVSFGLVSKLMMSTDLGNC